METPIIIEEKQKKAKTKKVKSKVKPKVITNNQKVQKIKETLIVASYFVFMILFTLLVHKFIQWNKYKDGGGVRTRMIEKKASYDDVVKYVGTYNESKTYHWEILRIKRFETKGFLRVKTTVTDKNKGLYSRDKY